MKSNTELQGPSKLIMDARLSSNIGIVVIVVTEVQGHGGAHFPI